MGWIGKRGEYGADAFGLWVGISVFAFCTDCGQPRELLRSSSGAKSRPVSQSPASRPITSSPARANGKTATPPTAPSPTTTTSAFLRLVAMPASPLREHRVVVRRLVVRFQGHAQALLLRRHRNTHSGIADQVPPDEVRVPAVGRVAERALYRVRPKQVEECRRVRRKARGGVLLHLVQYRVLVLRLKLGERPAFRGLGIDIQRVKTGGVCPACGRKRASERAVDVVRRAGLRGAGPVLVGRNQPRDDRLERVRLRGGDRLQRLPQWARCCAGLPRLDFSSIKELR